MAQLSSFLKLEVSKYKDIDHILKKLETDGAVKNMYDVFKGIFDNEFAFTHQELLRIQDSKKESINIRKQCENNLSLFKSNLGLIVQMIIDKALKNTLSQNKEKVSEVQESTTTTHEESVETGPSTANPLNQSPMERTEISKTQPRGRGIQTPSRDQISNVSAFFGSPKRGDSKVNLSNLNHSKAETPLSQILDKVHSPQRVTEIMTVNNINQTRVSRQSCTPTKNFRKSGRESSNSASRSFVQSEFNHITGSVKFSKSPRSREHIDLNPGPGTYDATDLKHSSSAFFEKSPKVCWFDTVCKTDSPGPHLNPSHHFKSK